MLRLLNGTLLAGILFVGILVSVASIGVNRFAALTRPKTQGYINELIDLKIRAAENITGPKIVIVSASGGLYSISCAILSAELGIPCVNEGLPVDVGVPAILNQGRITAKAGDIILMPMEYEVYYEEANGTGELKDSQTGFLNKIRDANWKRLFRVDFGYIEFGVAENIMRASGCIYYSIPSIFATNADRISHTAAAGAQYKEKRDKVPFRVFGGVITEGFRNNILKFFDWARSNNVKIIGTLPPSYIGTPLQPSWLEDIARLYRDFGFAFIQPESRHQYQRDDFYDGEPHLNQEAQFIHSRVLAKEIAPFIRAAMKNEENR